MGWLPGRQRHALLACRQLRRRSKSVLHYPAPSRCPAAGAVQARLAVLFASGLCAVYDLDQQASAHLLCFASAAL